MIKQYLKEHMKQIITTTISFIMAILIYYGLKRIGYPIVIKYQQKIEITPQSYYGNLYLNCEVIGESSHPVDEFTYNREYWLDDNMYFNWYMTLIQSRDNKDIRYFMITHNPIKIGTKLEFYYIIMNNGRWQSDTEYVHMIYPFYTVRQPFKLSI